MDPAAEFLEAYKALEEAVRRVYHLGREQSIVTALKNQRQFEDLKPEIQSCADLRNYFAHNSLLDGQYAAQPTASTIAFVKDLTARVNSRKKCRDICVRKKNIIWRSPDDLVKPAMVLMHAHGHSCIPILRNGVVYGVFDERALFQYAAESGGDLFRDGKLTFRDLDKYILITERSMQGYRFASVNAYADDVSELFETKLENGKRIRLILLTNSGRPNDRLQGILTPWDVLSI